jgi:hypothetical protein
VERAELCEFFQSKQVLVRLQALDEFPDAVMIKKAAQLVSKLFNPP